MITSSMVGDSILVQRRLATGGRSLQSMTFFLLQAALAASSTPAVPSCQIATRHLRALAALTALDCAAQSTRITKLRSKTTLSEPFVFVLV
jgi:hypothetical protein